MNKRMIFVLVAAFFALSAGFAFAQTVDEHLKKGDEYYTQLDNAKAMEEYLAAVQADPNNYEAAWKACRAMLDIGELTDIKTKEGEAKQKKYYKDSEAYGRKAVALNPNDTWGHFYLSAALGQYGLLLGKKEQIAMSREVKTEIEKAIQLDPNNDLAYHALGRWHRAIAEIGGAKRLFGSIFFGSIPKGSFEESAAALKKATELKPEFIEHHLQLARTYMEMDKYKEAVDAYQKAIDLPAATAKDPDYKKEAATEIVKAKKKAK